MNEIVKSCYLLQTNFLLFESGKSTESMRERLLIEQADERLESREKICQTTFFPSYQERKCLSSFLPPTSDTIFSVFRLLLTETVGQIPELHKITPATELPYLSLVFPRVN